MTKGSKKRARSSHGIIIWKNCKTGRGLQSHKDKGRVVTDYGVKRAIKEQLTDG